MRRLLAIYLIGIAVQIWPLVETQWDTVPASQMAASVAARVPEAATWPVRAFNFVRKVAALVDA